MKIGAMAGQHESGSSRVTSGNMRENSEERQNRGREEIDSVFVENEAVMLHNSDHPGMTLVFAPLIGSNYLSWSRSVKIALGAKTKLSFIDGNTAPLEIDSPWFANWRKADCMVLSWLLNSIPKDISESQSHSFTLIHLEISGWK